MTKRIRGNGVQSVQKEKEQNTVTLVGLMPSQHSRIIKALRKLPYEDVEELLVELMQLPQLQVNQPRAMKGQGNGNQQPMA